MNKHEFLKLVCAVFFIVFSVAQARWIPFDEQGLQRTTEINVHSASEFQVDVTINTYGFRLEEIDTKQITDVGAEIFALLSIDEYAYTGDIGKPKLPMVTTILDVPHQARITVEVLDYDVTEIDLAAIGIDKRIMPALASVPKIPNAKVQFIIDKKLYSTDKYFPDNIATIEEHGGYARGHKLATLQVFPIHYNPVKKTIRCYSNIHMRVNFIGGNVAHTQRMIAKDYSVIWEDFIEKMVVNYPNYLRGVAPLPIYYDIFYNGAFAEAAESLAHWKAKKGFKVRMWNATGWSAGAIDDTIEAQTPLATYLVIIGDPNSSTPLPPSGNGSSTFDQTDLYYAETDGSGYLPDLFNARIAVLNATEANTVVQKALRYEHANFGTAGTDWLKKACLIAGYDSNWQSFGMATNWYCRNLLVPHGYTVDTLVYAYGEQEGRVVNQINAGRAWCVYTAHGGQTEWWVGYSSDFNVSELTTLTNNLDMYPMPVGHCCLTGDYQYSTSCFGEIWDRLSDKGGICYFGSVPSTFWYEDDWLQRRYFDAIYADSVPGNLYETGRFTQWGLYWIENNTSSSDKRYYFEAYHLFNDPSLDFWTDIPDNIIVTHNVTVPPGGSNFTVTVKDDDGITPLEDALVCCWIPNQSPEMHVSDYTDAAGMVILTVSPMTAGDTMYVTVTKHNYLPYEGYALVASPGPYVSYYKHVVIDSLPGGNDNGQVNPGEMVWLETWVKNWGEAGATNVYGTLRVNDPYITLLDSTTFFGTVNAGDTAPSNPDFRFSVDEGAPNAHPIQFSLMTYAAGDTWNSQFSEFIAAPAIVYVSHTIADTLAGGNNNGLLEPGEAADLVVFLRNQGLAEALDVSATIATTDPYLSITTNSASYGTIPANTTVQSQTPYEVQADTLTPTPHSAEVVITITGTDYSSVDTFDIIIGVTGFYDSVEDTTVTNQYTVEGQWHRTERRNYSPTHAWWNGNEGTGQYSNNVDASIVTPLITLGEDTKLECWNWYNLESGWDYGYIEVSTDGGTNWTQLTTFNGTSSDWTKYSTTLEYPAGTQIMIRFRLNTDGSITFEGWYVDEIFIGEIPFELYDASVTPMTGEPTTTFTYEVNYKHPDGIGPSDSFIVIDSTAYTMDFVSGNYTTGAVYQYSTQLVTGTHEYYFEFTAAGKMVRLPWSGALNGPYVGFYKFYDDFEAGVNLWTVTGSWDTTHLSYHSPVVSLTDSKSGDYGNNINIWAAMAQGVDLTTATDVLLEFWHKYQFEAGYDSGFVEVSINGGSTWSRLLSYNGTTPFTWEQVSLGLNSYCGNADVRIRFRIATDGSVTYDGWYIDDVAILDYSGTAVHENAEQSMALQTILYSICPNPFMRRSQIRYQLATHARVLLRVYDISGRLVKNLISEDVIHEPGHYTVYWDGTDDIGRKVSAGVYFVRFEAEDFKSMKKAVLLK